MVTSRTLAWLALAAAPLPAVVACHSVTLPGAATCSPFTPDGPSTYSVSLQVTDDNKRPISGASVDTGDGSPIVTGANGVATLSGLTGPVLAMVSASGTLTEPVPVGWTSGGTTVSVHLWSTLGGKRWAMHNAGDSMFGRRYETPTNGTAPLIPESDPGPGAIALVSAVARAFSVADFKTVNFETTVTNLPDDSSYPGKRWILRTRPGALAALNQLDVSVVGLANNHQRDFLDVGVSNTTASLDALKIPHVGASNTDTPETPFASHVAGLSIGVLAFTGVDGTFVNDSYPPDSAPAETVGTDFAFKYQDFAWGFQSTTITIPNSQRRIGTAWQLFEAAEASPMSAQADINGAWASMTRVYPEVQDWVSRRGHGGAVPWNNTTSPAAVMATKASSDIVVVQLHDGFQFQEPPGSSVQHNARAAIDAGADLVICHHPHILQGFEFYKGKLIAYSMGNFVFDQDFLTSYGSGMLRSVWEGTQMLESRFIPVELNNYMPVVATDGGAVYGGERIWDLSNIGEVSMDDPNNGSDVRWFPTSLPPESVIPSMTLEHGTILISPTAQAPATITVTAAPGVTEIPVDGLVQSTLGLTSSAPIYVGKDLFAWGRFEDETVSSTILGTTHWALPSNECAQVLFTASAYKGRGVLREERFSTDTLPLEVSTVSAIPIVPHRSYQVDGAVTVPLDPDPSFSVRFASRTSGTATATLSIALYTFDDANPTEDPTSAATDTITFTIPPSDDWVVTNVPIDTSVLGADTVSNMVFLNFELAPSSSPSATLDIDNVAFIEWRQASLEPERFGRFGFVRNDGSSPVTLTPQTLSLGNQ